MPLQPMNVTNANGSVLFFGKDRVDGYPIQAKVVQNQTFYFDPHSDVFQRLRMEAQLAAGNVANGAGTIAPYFAQQTTWYRQHPSIVLPLNSMA
jgi:hypothetical protein